MGSKSLKTALTLLLACLLAVPAGLAWFCDCASHRPAEPARPAGENPHACCPRDNPARNDAQLIQASSSCRCFAADGCARDTGIVPVVARTASSDCTGGPVVVDAPVIASLPDVHAAGCRGPTGPPVRFSDPLLASSPSRAPPRTTGAC